MLNITTVDKRTQSKTGAVSDRILIARPSVVVVEAARADVVAVERVGQDAIIRLKNGQRVLLQGFYNHDASGLISDLVLTEPGVPLAWWSNPLDEWALARVEQIPAVDALLLAQEAGLPAVAAVGGFSGGAILGGLALLGAAAGGGGGSGSGNGGGTLPPAGGGTTGPTDTIRPTVQFSAADTRLALRESTEITIRFSEPVTGFTLADLQASGGTLSNLRAQADGITYVVTLTQDGTGTAPQVRLLAGGVADAAGNTNLEAVFGAADGLTVDTSVPTATIQLSRTQLQPGESAIVTITFSESVNGFSLDDLQAENADLSNLVQSLINPLVYTASLTARAGVNDATNLVTLREGGYTDAAGNVGAAATGPNYEIRAAAPQQQVRLNAVQDDVPLTTGAVPRDGMTNDNSPLLSGDLTAPLATGQVLEVFADGVKVGEALVNGTQWTLQVTGLTNGLHTFTARVLDSATGLAGVSAAPFSITVDTMAPAAATIDVVATDDIINAAEQQGVITGTTEANATVLLSLGGFTRSVTANAQGVWSYTLMAEDISGMGQGAETISVQVRDAAGNESVAATRAISVDTAAPAAPTINVVAGDDIINAAEQQSAITGTAEAGATVLLSLGSSIRSVTANAQGAWSYTLVAEDISGMGQGPETLSVQVRDAAGNVSAAATRAITVDTVAPTLNNANPSSYSDNTGAVQSANSMSPFTDDTTPGLNIGVIPVGSTPVLFVNGVAVAATYSAAAGTLTPTAALANGTVKLAYSLVDAAGNESVRSGELTVTIDTAAPAAPTINVVAGDDIINAAEQQSTITGTAEAGATVLLSLGGFTRTLTANAQGAWSYTLVAEDIGGMGQGDEILSVRARDVAGNVSAAATRAITVDTVAPTLNNANPSSYADNIGVVQSANSTAAVTDDTTPGLNIGVIPAGTTPVLFVNGVAVVATYSAADGTLTPKAGLANGTVKLAYSLVDAAGNESVRSGELTVTIDTAAPAAPTINVVAGDDIINAAEQQSTITGTAEAGATVLLSLGGSIRSVTANAQGAWSYTLVAEDISGMGQGPETLSVQVRDAAGNVSAATTRAITADTAAPGAPTITLSDANLTAGETATVTITFSEAVSGFTLDDLVAQSGTVSALSAPTVNDNGTVTYTATFTPAQNTTAANNRITIAQGAYTDQAGNDGAAGQSGEYAVDTVVPVDTGDAGAVADGYLSGATVFRDLDGDGVRDENESAVLTNELGQFTGLLGAGGLLIAVGGTDIATGAAFGGVLSAPDGSIIINPLTTLVSALLGDTRGLGAEEIAQRVMAAEVEAVALLGLNPAIRPTQFDPLAVIRSNAGDTSLAVETQLAAVALANVLLTATAALRETGMAATDSEAAALVAAGLRGLSELAKTAPGGVIDLSSVDVVKRVFDDAAAAAVGATPESRAKFDGLAQNVAQATAHVNRVVEMVGERADPADSVTTVVKAIAAQLSIVEAGGLLSAIQDAAGGAPFPDDRFTVEALQSRQEANEERVLDVDGDKDPDPLMGKRPTAEIAVGDTDLSPGESTTVTITFSEAVEGFELGDLQAENATLSNLQQDAQNPLIYRATMTAGTVPVDDITNTVSLADSYRDVSGKLGQAANSNNYIVRAAVADTVAPDTPTIDVVAGDDLINAAEQGSTITGTAEAGATVLLSLGGSIRSVTANAQGAWSYTLVAEDISAMEQGAETISVQVRDAAGNVSAAATRAITVDTAVPAAPTINVVAGDDIINAAEQQSTITGTAEAGATVLLSLGGFTRTLVANAQGAWSYTLVAEDIIGMEQGAETLSVQVRDAAGNVSAATTRAITVDTAAPGAPTITLSDANLTAGETATVTITFSEAVSGFTLDDLVAQSGTVSALSAPTVNDNGTVTYTATFTPAENTTAANNQITIAQGAYTDQAGNEGAAGQSEPYTVNTAPPPDPVSIILTAIGDDTATVAGPDGESDFITSDRTLTVFASTNRELTSQEVLQIRVRPAGSTVDSPWTDALAHPSAANGWFVSSELLNVVTGMKPGAAFDLGNYTIESRVISLADKTLAPGAVVRPIGVAQAQNLQIVDNTAPVVSSQGGSDLSQQGVNLSAVGANGATGQRFVVGDYDNNLKAVRLLYEVQLDSKQLDYSRTLAAELGLAVVLTTASTVEAITVPGANAPIPLSGQTTSTITITAVDGGVVDAARVNELLASVRLTTAPVPGLPAGAQLNTSGVSVQSTFTLTVSDQGLDAEGNLLAPQTTSTTSAAALSAQPAAGYVEGSDAEDDLVTGTANSEFLFGYGGNDTLNGDAGNDVLRGGAGTDSLSGGAGEDTMVLDLGTQDRPGFGRDTFDGGEGTDTLRIEGNGVVDFVATAEADGATSLTELEVIDLGKGNGSQTVVLNELLVTQITGNGNQLTVLGDQADRLIFTPGSVAGQRTVIGADGNAFVEYTMVNDKVVLVEDGIRVSIETPPPPPPVDDTPPTATISLSSTSLSAGQTATVTITFSEPVTGFGLVDLMAPNGVLSDLSGPTAGLGGAVVYTATFTPNGGVNDDTNLITLSAGSYTDLAGNAGMPAQSVNYAVNTQEAAPTQTVVIAAIEDNEGTVVGPVMAGGVTNDTTPLVTGTLSAVLTGGQSLQVFNGSALLGQATVDGSNWSFAVPAGMPLAQGLVTITARVVNAAGDAGPASAAFGFTVDTTGPQAPTLSLSDAALTLGESAIITLTFAEAVLGVEVSDFRVDGNTAVVSDVIQDANDPKVWRATLTPNTGVRETTRVAFDSAGVTDRAGNVGVNPSAGPVSQAFSINTVEPVNILINSIGDDTLTVAGPDAASDFITSDRTISVFALTDRQLTANEVLQIRVRPVNGVEQTAWTDALPLPNAGNGWFVSSEMLNAITGMKPTAAFDAGDYTIEARVILLADKTPAPGALVEPLGVAAPQSLQIVGNSAPVASSQGGADLSAAGIEISAVGVNGATGQRFVVGDYENNIKVVRLVYVVQLDSKQLAYSQTLADELGLTASLITVSGVSVGGLLPGVTSPVPLSGQTTSTLDIRAVDGGTVDVGRVNELLASLRLTNAPVPGLPAGAQLNTTGVSVQAEYTLSVSDQGVDANNALIDPRTVSTNSAATLSAQPASGFVEGTVAGDDAVVGTANSEFLFGYGGNDTLTGDAGDDVLRGGAGNDSLLGGAGDDTLVLNLDDDVDGVGLGRDTFDGGDGIDTLRIEGTGAILDFVATADPTDGTTTVTDIEILDLGKGNGAQAVVLDELLVTQITGNGGLLTIRGDQADTVTFKPGAVSTKRVVIGADGNAYTEYTLANAKVVLVEDGLRVIDQSPAPMGFALTPIIGG